MDPCRFIRLTVGNLALKTPVRTKPDPTVIHPTTTSPCFARIKLNGFPTQTTTIPFISPGLEPIPESLAATFHLSSHDLLRLSKKGLLSKRVHLTVEVRSGDASCGVVRNGRLLGRVSVPLDFGGVDESTAVVYRHNGWARVGKEDGHGGGLVHFYVRVESDPRFVFQFDGEPECSPQVFQLHGCLKQQPVFTCNFSCRPNAPNHRLLRPRSLQSEQGSGKGWLSTFGSERERPGKERKGWSLTVHDLSGSPVAAASMVTPFVASPGSDRVSRSNPGSWLILRPGEGTWKPWGRLEAWRERGPSDGLGYRFELIPDIGGSNGVVLAESTLSTCKGGKFTIDLGLGLGSGLSKSANRVGSPGCSPRGGSGDFKLGVWPYGACKGFVMSTRVEGEGKCSKPTVEVGVQHVACTEDAAAYVALAAAIDLSMDACRLFSHKLRKELCQPSEKL